MKSRISCLCLLAARSRPARGAWVEIVRIRKFRTVVNRRAPQGARGLKFCDFCPVCRAAAVAPRKGRVG